MKKVDFTCTGYSLKLKQPFETSKGRISERKGFLIRLKSDTGKTGTGDAAPFPEFGSETYEQAEEALKNIRLKINLNLNDLEKSIGQILHYFNLLPSLRHGFEQALLNLISKERNLSLNEMLNETSRKEINVNAVIGILTPEDSVREAEKFIKQGYKTLKLKAGRNKFEDEFECIKAVRDSAGSGIKIRIDVNGKWELSQAISRLKKLEPLKLEYVEQPVKSIEEFIELKNNSFIPLAADESIRTLKDAAEFIKNKAADVLILKPMMLGGIIPALNIKTLSTEAGLKVVFTSSFESVVGRSMAVFAASTVKDNIAHGLAADNYFEKDLFPNPYPVKNGAISLSTN